MQLCEEKISKAALNIGFEIGVKSHGHSTGMKSSCSKCFLRQTFFQQSVSSYYLFRILRIIIICLMTPIECL